MKKQLLTGLFGLLALGASAQTFKEWQDPEVNAVNRAPMHTNYFAFESVYTKLENLLIHKKMIF